jgi:hypothetical protein
VKRRTGASAEQRGQGDAGDADPDQDPQDAVQDAVGLVQRPRDLDGAGAPGADREQAQVRALDVHVAQRLALARGGDRSFRAGDGQRARLVRRPLRGAVGRDELHVALSAAEAPGVALARTGRRTEPPARDRAPPARRARAGPAQRELRHRPRAVAQRIVDLAAQLRADGHVDADRHRQHDHRDGEPGAAGDAAPEGHGSRST